MMTTWNELIYFALPSALCWITGALFAYKDNKRNLTLTFTCIGLIIFGAFITLMWISLERPPLRTMGETRLWYSFFLPIAGLITYLRWQYKWILSFSTIMSIVFITINIIKPEIHNKTLMPALQSVWFAPHVIIYMFSYAMLGAGGIVSIYILLKYQKQHIENKMMNLIDNFIYVGTAFFIVGMLFGALWAKEAWGHYWGWDPKETWAAATWLELLMYIHFRTYKPTEKKTALIIAIIAVLLLQMCWFGVNYLPSAQKTSIHIYNLN